MWLHWSRQLAWPLVMLTWQDRVPSHCRQDSRPQDPDWGHSVVVWGARRRLCPHPHLSLTKKHTHCVINVLVLELKRLECCSRLVSDKECNQLFVLLVIHFETKAMLVFFLVLGNSGLDRAKWVVEKTFVTAYVQSGFSWYCAIKTTYYKTTNLMLQLC